jgi:hypothetical protein
VLAGQTPAAFDDYTIREIDLVLEASAVRDARVAWQAAQYMRFAHHDPNNMPPMPSIESARSKIDPRVAEEMRRIRDRAKILADARRAKHGR